MLTMYAIPNCDTVKKARKWLESHNIKYAFHDYKKAGVPEDKLTSWVKEKGWESIVNMRGMTWRRMSDEERVAITNEKSAIALMMDKSSVIKRPILENTKEGLLVVGFNEETYMKL